MTDILVLGAGMVGISTALALQDHGHAVTIIDRKAPGQETSYGNAGIIQAEAAEPYPLPRDLSTLTKMGLGLTNDVVWSPRGLMQMAPALASYFRYSAPFRHAQISRVYSDLITKAIDDHAPLISASNAQNLISQEGFGVLLRNQRAFEKAARDAERLASTYNLSLRLLDGGEAMKDEPLLKARPAGVLHWPQSWTCSDPGGLTQAYATLFQNRGGVIATGDAASLAETSSGWSVQCQKVLLKADAAVVALGPWSPALLKRFGYRVPMVYKRGYHGHFESHVTLRRPFLDGDNGIVVASMRKGLRIATGAALVSPDAPANPKQLHRGRKAISDMLEIGNHVEEPQWVGTRPCMPDMLPMVGKAPGHKNLWFNFGHGHQGFTLGPTTGRRLADEMENTGAGHLLGLEPSGRLNP